MLRSVRLSVCLSVPCFYGKTLRFRHNGYYRIPIRNLMLEVEPTSHRGPMTTGSDQNGLDLDNYTQFMSPNIFIKKPLKTRIGNLRLPINSHNHRYRLTAGKARTRLFISSAHLSTVRPNCHRREAYRITHSLMGDAFLLLTYNSPFLPRSEK